MHDDARGGHERDPTALTARTATRDAEFTHPEEKKSLEEEKEVDVAP